MSLHYKPEEIVWIKTRTGDEYRMKRCFLDAWEIVQYDDPDTEDRTLHIENRLAGLMFVDKDRKIEVAIPVEEIVAIGRRQ